MIRLEGRITLFEPARLPIGCWTYLSFTDVTTRSFLFDHQLSGMMRTFGMAASAAGEPARIVEDCTDSDGTERVSDDKRGAR